MNSVRVYCNAMWLIGFACVFIGSILNLVALPFCDLVLFSTTVGIAIVFNHAIAIKWLGEKIVWKYDVPAFLLVVGGSTAIVLLSKVDDEAYTPESIEHYLSQAGTIVLVIATFVLLILALLSLKLLVDSTRRFEEDVRAWVTTALQRDTVASKQEAHDLGTSYSTVPESVADKREFKEQPARVLIQVVNAIPEDVLREISPRSTNLRRFSKVPMVMLLSEAAIQIGLDIMCFKFAQVLLEDGYFADYWPGITILFVAGIILALSNLHFINLSVKYYDATDVVPVLNAATMIAEIVAGLIVGGEYHLYDGFELTCIFLCSLICIAGIQVLVMKTSQMNLESADENEIRSLSITANQAQLLEFSPGAEGVDSRLKRFEPKLVKLFTSGPDEDRPSETEASNTIQSEKAFDTAGSTPSARTEASARENSVDDIRV